MLSVISQKLKRSHDPEHIPFEGSLLCMYYYSSSHQIWNA